MKNTISTLKLALVWWNNKSNEKKLELHAKYFLNIIGMLTDTQITEIFVQETANIDKTDIESAYLMQNKMTTITKLRLIELSLKVWNAQGFNGSFEQRDLGLKYFPNEFDIHFDNCILYILSNEAFIWWNSLKNYYLQGELSKKYFNSEVGVNYNLLVDNEIVYIYLMEKLEKKPNKIETKQTEQINEEKFKTFISLLESFDENLKFNCFIATLKQMKLDSATMNNIMTLVALKDF